MRAREIIPSFLGGFFGFALLVALNGAGIVPAAGGGLTADQEQVLGLFSINGSNLELDSGYSLKIDSTRKLFTSIIQANSGTSLDLREDGGSSSVTIGTSGDTTFAQNIIGTHGKGLLAGATGDGFLFNVSGSDGSFLFAVNGSAVSNYSIIPTGTVRTNDVRAGSYYNLTGAGPAVFYSGAIIYPTALPGSPATGQLVCDSGAANVIKSWDGSSWLTH